MGGIELCTKSMVDALKQKYEQKVICFSSTAKNITDKDGTVEIIRCGAPIKMFSQAVSFSYYAKLKETMENFKPDIIIFQFPNPLVAEMLLKLIKNEKLIVFYQSDIYRQKLLKYLFEVQNHRLLKKADLILASSEKYVEGSRFLRKYREKVEILHLCILKERQKQFDEILAKRKEKNEKSALKKDTITFLFVGRHVEYKGLKYLVAASKMVEGNFKLLIAGTGPLTRKLKKAAEGNEKIKFLGRVSEKKLAELFAEAEVFCFPSITKNEAYGISLIEAMYMHLPAVTFTIEESGVNSVCVNGETGIEVKNKDVQAYAASMQKFIEDKELIKKYGEAAHKRAEKEYLFGKFENTLNQIIEKVEEQNQKSKHKI